MHRESSETHWPQRTWSSTFLTLVPAGTEQPGLSSNLPLASTSLEKSSLYISDKHMCLHGAKKQYVHAFVYTNTYTCTYKQECLLATGRKNTTSATERSLTCRSLHINIHGSLMAHAQPGTWCQQEPRHWQRREALPCPGVASLPDIHGPVTTEGCFVTQQGGRTAHGCKCCPTWPAGWAQDTAQTKCPSSRWQEE